MKKITAILIAVIMIVGVLSVATTAMDEEHVQAYFVDWYAYAGSFISQTGKCDELVQANMPVYEMHADPSADIVGFYGWAALKDGVTTKAFGVSLDGGAIQEQQLSREQGLPDRREEIGGVIGVSNAEGFWIVFYYTALGPGKHNAAFYAISEDGKGHELFNYDFTVIEKYPDQWLCNSAAPDSVAPGLWSNPLTAGQTCTLTFDATTSFSGFCMMFYANPEGATVDISLLDKNGKELEKLTHNQKGDGAPTLAFSKTYGPDTYTLKFVSVSAEKHIDPTAGEMDGWFVIGTADPGDTAVTVGGDYTTNEYTRAGILAFLVGAVKESNAGENNNPGTADAAVIAIAAVACLALAGIVVAKKIK